MSSSTSAFYLHPAAGNRMGLHSPLLPSAVMARNVPSVLRRRHRNRLIRNRETTTGTQAVIPDQHVNGTVVVEPLPFNEPIGTIGNVRNGSSLKGDTYGKTTSDSNGNSSLAQEEAATSSNKPSKSLQTVEFSFLDNKNVCCGLCGEIVLYDHLMNDHLPNSHPDIFSSDAQASSEILADFEHQQRRLKEKLSREKRSIETGFKMAAYRSAVREPKFFPSKRRRSGEEPSRKVSTIRVNPRLMPLAELEEALKKKMYEKLNRRVPVSLTDRIHARCGICNAIISLNKKFEIIHLVRHFNCWHPTIHVCSGSWPRHQPKRRGIKSLSIHDFAVVDTGSGSPDSIQCIWCGMFVEPHCLAQHFGELHPDDVEVPKCNLCMQELILTARFQEKFNMELQITLPDEHHMKCSVCGISVSSDISLETHIQRRHIEGLTSLDDPQVDEDDVNLEEIGPEAFSNSRMVLGKRRRPKRQFIMPALRQAVPLDSQYVEPIAECHWKCKLCDGDIYGAVISAAAIRHYKYRHPDDVDKMQYEICKSRLEKISDGCMEFVHPQLIECLLCQQSFNLHQPFNMCRAIRHLKAKHPNLMPEYAGLTHFDELEAEEENVHATMLRRQCGTATAVVAPGSPVIYDQQHLLHTDLSQVVVSEGLVYSSKIVQPDGGDDEEETEEIIIAAGTSGALALDGDSAMYTQQFVMDDGEGSALSTPVPYSSGKCELGNLITLSEGIRVFRTPQRYRYYGYNCQGSTAASIAAKNAHLDHGAIVRQLPPLPQLPPLVSISHPQSMHRPPHTEFLDQQMVEASPPVVFHHDQQPRQYYLLLQTSADDVLHSGHHSLLDSSLVGGSLSHDRSLDRRSAISVIDDPMIEAHRLNELMAQTHSAMTSSIDDRQPQSLMAGDDPF